MHKLATGEEYIPENAIPLTYWNLSDEETSCIDHCASTYTQMLNHMIENFRHRATFQ